MKRIAILAAIWSLAASAQKIPGDLAEFTMEDLMNIEVTSVSKKEQSLLSAPAAIYVITQEDIRRSGLSSIPEILRMAPGLEVARIDGNKWAISSRGFNAQFGKMMLVLIDGRSVYLPSYSGVAWNEHGTIIEDIDRIEVIRGPGATLWGANAVNGVINIITKSAGSTQGGLVTATHGNDDRMVDGARYGGLIGQRGAYRIFSQYSRRADLPEADGPRRADGIMLRSGFRSDWELSERDSLTVQGDLFRETAEITDTVPTFTAPFRQSFTDTEKTRGGNFISNWRHRSSEHSLFTLLGYFDHAQFENAVADTTRSIFNLDFQHSWSRLPRQDIVWGLGFRNNVGRYRNSQTLSFLPAKQTQQLYSAFVQDEFHLVRDRLSVVVGSKFERNAFTGAEIQPNVRLAWTPSPRTTVWASVARAVRTPSHFEEVAQYTFGVFPTETGLLAEVRTFGSTNSLAEVLRAHEIGYRSRLGKRFSVDWTGFYNAYHHLTTYEPAAPFLTPDPQPFHLVIPLIGGNKMRGESLGMEIMGAWEVARRWRISSAYSLLTLQVHLDPSRGDTLGARLEGRSPRHQVQFRSEIDLGRRVQFDTRVYHVGSLPSLSVPSYTRIDARLGWRLGRAFEFSAGGQNLQGGRHLEFISEGPYATSRVGRSFYTRIVWRSE